ncbi:retrotransposon Ty1-copia subclass [Penicillium bovifimosum]|uniref:Retrotransposon Ty1-copia subclass n=1 Tax=Penicillium bovifimosum TaxID=126998 RepID=A0A9W9HF69_9EURO|nr:retrotransposon Ty1-copia subclass [Penicillium bovifimosum]KAJ5145459.1 retrotransposon Ty1-copia subclass [Penicillium bovifimosum]
MRLNDTEECVPLSPDAQLIELETRRRQLDSSKYDRINEYINEFRDIRLQTKRLGIDNPEAQWVTLFMAGLDSKWNLFKTIQRAGRTVMRIGSDTTTPLMKVDDLIRAILTEESDNRGEQPSFEFSSGEDITVKIPFCSHCGTVWHKKSECYQLYPHLNPKTDKKEQKRRRADTAGNAQPTESVMMALDSSAIAN